MKFNDPKVNFGKKNTTVSEKMIVKNYKFLKSKNFDFMQVPSNVAFESALILLKTKHNPSKESINIAKEYLQIGVAKKHVRACFELCLIHFDGKFHTKKDRKKAYEYATMAVKIAQYGRAYVSLGLLYETGIKDFLKPDLNKAFKCYKNAMKDKAIYEDKYALAAFKLGQMYSLGDHMNGFDQQTNTPKALKYLKLARKWDDGSLRVLVNQMISHCEMRMNVGLVGKESQKRSDQNMFRLSDKTDEIKKEKGLGENDILKLKFLEWTEITRDYGGMGVMNEEMKLKEVGEKELNWKEFININNAQFETLNDFKYMNVKPFYRCGFCNAKKKNMKSCSRCREYYCDKVCQKKDWKIHKKTCKLMSNRL